MKTEEEGQTKQRLPSQTLGHPHTVNGTRTRKERKMTVTGKRVHIRTLNYTLLILLIVKPRT